MADDVALSQGEYFDASTEAFLPARALSAPFTLEGWFVWVAGSGSLLRDDAGTGTVSLAHDVDGLVAWRVGDDPVVTTLTIASLGDEWHHLVLACGAEQSSLFLDGREVSTAVADEPRLAPPLVLMRGVEGFVADVAVYAERLTPDRVRGRSAVGRARTI